jgi:hypothetical protein
MITLSKKNNIYLLLITLVGVILRISWIIKINCIPISDFKIYREIATNVCLHGTHSYMNVPVSFQGPGYTLILGAIYKLFSNNSILTAKILNVILSSLTLCNIIFIFSRLFKNKILMITAYTFIVLNPNYISYNNVLGSFINLFIYINYIITAN